MLQIAVLANPRSWYLRDLQRAAIDRCRLATIPFRRLAAGLDSGRPFFAGPDSLGEFDALLVRTMPPGTLEQVVFRMDVLGRLEAAGVAIVNPPRALETAVDKYLSLAKLRSAGLPVPATVVCQDEETAMEAFVALGGDVVVKPLFGGEGRGIARVTDEAVAFRTFRTLEQLGAVIYVQRFVPHDGSDLRLFVVGSQVLAMRRRHPTDWRTNISRGAKAEPLELEPEWVDLARRAAGAVGAPWAGVDILPGQDGRCFVLEVNAVPGWRALARTTGVDVAALVLDHIEDRVDAAQRRAVATTTAGDHEVRE